MDRVTKAFLILIGATICYFFYLLYDENQYLYEYIDKQDKQIDETIAIDSSFIAQNENLTQQLSNFLTEDGCGIQINGKDVSSSELVKILSETFKENDSLRNALNEKSMDVSNLKKHEGDLHKLLETSQDSVFILSSIVKFAKRDYGIEYKVEPQEGNKISFIKSYGKADSALSIYPIFKDRIIIDSATGKTSVLLPDVQLNEQQLKNIRRQRKKYRRRQ